MKSRIVEQWKRIGGVLGAILFALVTLIFCLLQPIGGLPGYKIVRQDITIIFGFVLMMGVFGLLGYLAGRFAGESLGKSREQQIHLQLRELEQNAPVKPHKTVPETREQKIAREVFSLLPDIVFEKTEKLLSAGMPVNDKKIREEAIEEASYQMMRKYGLSYQEIIGILKTPLKK